MPTVPLVTDFRPLLLLLLLSDHYMKTFIIGAAKLDSLLYTAFYLGNIACGEVGESKVKKQ